jgi:hypothetical protein
MSDVDAGLQDLSTIRSMMERASRFLSLSGLSGVSAGIAALAGAWLAAGAIGGTAVPVPEELLVRSLSPRTFLIIDASVVLVLALGLSVLFSRRMARKKGVPIWSSATKFVLVSLAVPLAAGGAFCLILVHNGIFFLIPSAMLVFYGLALFNAGTNTVGEVRYLGILEIILGLLAAVWAEHGLAFWAIGFGVLHILYGILLYAKYEK